MGFRRPSVRIGLLREVVHLALDTLRTNKLRSGLTVLGVVIGITAIVGMTSLIRGFDQSLRDSIRELGPSTVFLAKFSGISLAAGNSFDDLLRRPNITVDDATAIEKLAPSVGIVDIWLGAGGPPTQARVTYDGERTKQLAVLGATENFAEVNFLKLEAGRFFTEGEVARRRNVVVLGDTPYQALFGKSGLDPVGKKVRIGQSEYTVIGVVGKRPAAGGFNLGQDDLVVIPETTYRKQFGIRMFRRGDGIIHQSVLIVAAPRVESERDTLIAEIQEIMRIRHGLKVDEANDFDIGTQDAALRVWEQVSRAVLLALVVISSIALMVGGIGVMAIMMISVTERTREIGVRKALGARRREILFQFLAEAVVLTAFGGILGIACGSAIGMLVNVVTGFPVSLPWWSFALGLGFSAAVGIFFGMVPAVRAARLDPIEALRHE
ncbi:MAG: FtsX-like permease family protein [Acidimicrobiia bacterium]|nr:FtsX-like permease family protein [Acidimicrobiia bacterium]